MSPKIDATGEWATSTFKVEITYPRGYCTESELINLLMHAIKHEGKYLDIDVQPLGGK